MKRSILNYILATLILVIGLPDLSARVAMAESHEAIFPAQRSSLTPLLPLEEGWADPPREARTRCWWWWLNGNVTAEAITRDLEEMKAKGFGGANIIDAGGATQTGHDQVPHGPDFGSPEWRVLFLHALAEADRLGLEIGFNIVSGWNLGGPTVTPEQASKKLAWTSMLVDGGELGAAIDLQLDQPPSVADYYRDVAIVAFPDPGETPAMIERFRPKAYHDYPSSSSANDAGWLLDAGGGNSKEAVDPQSVRDISDAVDEQGRLRWQAPPGRWRVLRLGYTLSNSLVSTSSEGWNGWAIDYLDREAFDKYWQDIVAPLLDEAKPYLGKTLRYLHTDSWELGPVNWTPRLPAEFAKRRGYKLDALLPALAGYVVGNRDESNRFLADFRRTLAELIAENNYGAFAEHAHAHGMGIHPESGGPHAAPIDALLCLSKSDIMMGEFWGQSPHRPAENTRFFTKQPASAAHLYGRRTVLAEAFTTIGPHWEEGPRELKPVFDRAACEGMNLAMLHTFDCSPPEMGLPGQAYFAGTHINPNTTWWHSAGPFFAYLNRCQFMLQQGLPVNDVLYFYGENVPSFVRLKEDDPARVLPGYDYDVTNADALITRTHVEDGRITLPDGVSYAALVLPACGNGYGLESLRHIAKLVDGGATVIGAKPKTPMGLAGGVEAAAEFAALADRLWPTGTVKDAVGQGEATPKHVIAGTPTRDVLRELNLPQDFEFLSPTGDQQVDFIHRRTSEGDLYFIANRLDRWETGRAIFRIAGRQPELWDPISGERRDAPTFTQDQATGQTTVPLMLPPHGSMFVLFRRPAAEGVANAAKPQERLYRPIVKIIGPWRVYFDPARGGTGEVTFGVPGSWTWRTEEGNKHYSGPVDYRITFEMPPGSVAAAKKAGRSFWLDLGEVKNIAQAELNGKPIGTAWTAPFRFDATSAMREGANELKVTVTNLWPNRLIGDAKLPPEQRITRTNIRKFKADSPLMLSGMLGPVQVLERE